MKVKRNWVITLLLVVSFALWWFEAKYLFLTEWGEFSSIFLVGVLSGAGYVNAMYFVLINPKIEKIDKEAAINILCCSKNAGIVSASLFSLILDNFLMN